LATLASLGLHYQDSMFISEPLSMDQEFYQLACPRCQV
jgi:hypothetical protein